MGDGVIKITRLEFIPPAGHLLKSQCVQISSYNVYLMVAKSNPKILDTGSKLLNSGTRDLSTSSLFN